MAKFELRAWALKGAEQRLLEIGDEAAAIYAAFPELRDRGSAARAGQRGGRPRLDGQGQVAPRRKRTMSPEARRRISEAQKARWAKQKRGAAPETPAPAAAARSRPTKTARTRSPKKK